MVVSLYFDLVLSLFSNQMVRIITMVTAKMPSIPFPIMGSVSFKDSGLNFMLYSVLPRGAAYHQKVAYDRYFTSVRIKPPAITDAICPETFTPMECISRKFWLSSWSPSL